MTAAIPVELARFCRDCYLLARAGLPGAGEQPPGRAWEREVSSLLCQPGLPRRQHAGGLGLFGNGAASGASHEFDGAGHGPGCGIWIEAKAGAEISKQDVAVFRLKCDDLFLDSVRFDPRGTAAGRWWPVLASSTPAPELVRRLCLAHGIVLCDPGSLPLPTVLRLAAKPEADLHLSETLLGEAVRLFEPACTSMQERWRLNPTGTSLERAIATLPSPKTIGETMFIQDELSRDILEYMEREHPGALHRRGQALSEMLRDGRRPALSGAR